MYLNYHVSFTNVVHGMEKFFFLLFRAIIAVVVISLTICLIVNIVIPIATQIIPLMNGILTSFLLKIFGSY